jgi:uncharacterized membrane protein YadS
MTMFMEPQEGKPQEDKPPKRRHSPWFILAVVAVVLFVGYHVLEAEATKSTPPAACQLLGGHWNIWGGWRCG